MGSIRAWGVYFFATFVMCKISLVRRIRVNLSEDNNHICLKYAELSYLFTENVPCLARVSPKHQPVQ